MATNIEKNPSSLFILPNHMLISPGNITRNKHEIMLNQTYMPEPSEADKEN